MRLLRSVMLSLLAGLLQCVAVVPPCGADTCAVPSQNHQTLQSAIDDTRCTEIDLAAGIFVESPSIARSLVILGAGSEHTRIIGSMVVGAGDVELNDIRISDSREPLSVGSGAQLGGTGLVVLTESVATPIFTDGFESGTTAFWSSTNG